MSAFLLLFLPGLRLTTLVAQSVDSLEEQVLYRVGTGGCHTYRTPSLLTTPRGTVLAFCEGCKQGQSDTGDVDLLPRRSTDGGQTWTISFCGRSEGR